MTQKKVFITLPPYLRGTCKIKQTFIFDEKCIHFNKPVLGPKAPSNKKWHLLKYS
jgi:hypothetical protein